MTTQNLSSQISSIYTSRNVVLNLMKRQGYNVNDYDKFSINEVNTMKQNNQLDMLLEKNEEDETTKRKNKIYIKYYLGKILKYFFLYVMYKMMLHQSIIKQMSPLSIWYLFQIIEIGRAHV